jgi:hypothetical protein
MQQSGALLSQQEQARIDKTMPRIWGDDAASRNMKIPASAIYAALPATSNGFYLSPLAAVLTEGADMNPQYCMVDCLVLCHGGSRSDGGNPKCEIIVTISTTQSDANTSIQLGPSH